MTESGPVGDQERRQYFRIEDTVRVSVRRLPEAELEERLARLEQGMDGTFTVMASLAAITAQLALHLRRIENDQPDVAAYLKGLDRKLDVLGRALIAQDPVLASEDARAVSLSAGGMALDVREPLPVGSQVEIRMLLFPSFTGVLTYGEVVGCEPPRGPGAAPYHLRVEFTHIREPDRDILIRHILRRQGDELRARRPGP